MIMRVLIVFDSVYGNTQKIAVAVARATTPPYKAKLLKTSEASLKDLQGVNLLIVGSPTHGGQPTPGLRKFLSQIPAGALKRVGVAAFDTRFAAEKLNFALKLLVKTIGYAAPKMADILENKGGKLIASPEGFIVTGKEGPLEKGETTRAKTWVKKLIN